jgi:hypothetical protein
MRTSTQIALAILVAGLPSLAQAFPSLKQRQEQLVESLKKKSKLQTHQNECSDFSGTWIGTCTRASDLPRDSSIVIQQDSCSTLSFPERLESYGIPGTVSYHSSDAISSGFFDVSVDWRENQTVAQFEFSGGGRLFGGGSINVYELQTLTLQLIDGKLHSKELCKAKSIGGLTLADCGTDICIYEKRP